MVDLRSVSMIVGKRETKDTLRLHGDSLHLIYSRKLRIFN